MRPKRASGVACMCTHVAAVVDEAGKVSALGGVDDGVVVDPKQVAATDAFLCVLLLTVISHHLRDHRSQRVKTQTHFDTDTLADTEAH